MFSACLASPARGKGEVAELSRDWSCSRAGSEAGFGRTHWTSRPWLESRALHFQAPEIKELDLMVPCCNFLFLLWHLPGAESGFEFMS